MLQQNPGREGPPSAGHASLFVRAWKPALPLLLWLLLLLLAFGVGLRGWQLALESIPLDAYGLGGGEVLPHLQRLYAERHWTQGGSFYELLRALDGQYPALLHLLAVLWRRLLGFDLEDFRGLAALNLPLLLLGAGCVGHTLVKCLGRPAWQGLWLTGVVWLLPGLLFPARRYYYDLPMTVGILGVGALLLTAVTSPRGVRWGRLLLATFLTGATLLIKWAAALYLLPIWAVGLGSWLLVTPRERTRQLETLAQAGLVLLLLGVGLWPLLQKPDGSFQFMRGVGGPEQGLLAQPWAALRYQLGTVWAAGVGPVGSLLLLLSLALGLWHRERWPLLLRLTGGLFLLTLPPLLYLVLFVHEWDGRYLMPLLPWWMGLLLLGCGAEPHEGQASWTPPPTARALLWPVLSLLLLCAQHQYLDGVAQPRAREWWFERWWLGRADARPTLLPSLRPVVQQLLKDQPARRVLVATGQGGVDLTQLMQYLLERESGGQAELVAWPSEPELGAWREQLRQTVEVLVISGEPPAPERWQGIFRELPSVQGPVPLRLYVRSDE